MGLLHKTTAEMTERELELAYDAYIRSKCVNGRYCPTPELHTKDEMSDDETSSESISPCSSNAVHAIPRDANREWAERCGARHRGTWARKCIAQKLGMPPTYT